MKNNKQYSDEFKELIIKECQETGNVALVARRHEISSNTIHTWLSKYRKYGTVKPLPRAKDDVFVNRKFPHILIENSPTNSQKKHVYSCSSNHFLVSFKR
jgi:transposase-like protein